ncbi:hypothetical protein KIN20_029409 [Parelaphostrongylus tenuis]|uniref:Uncharacterized protein n=1 Tax=Parelaphostrongylus tenuis TaxID=148309 RepID=A0AAD5WFZ1_PARTN|nr:hypothetical protein KIN20_029409 [Parelaphostrongylus tenuis]
MTDADAIMENRRCAGVCTVCEDGPFKYPIIQVRFVNFLAENGVLVMNEDSNTVDIGRTMIPSVLQRRRLDAETLSKVSAKEEN